VGGSDFNSTIKGNLRFGCESQALRRQILADVQTKDSHHQFLLTSPPHTAPQHRTDLARGAWEGGALIATPLDTRACGAGGIGQRLGRRHGGAVSDSCLGRREPFSTNVSLLQALSRSRH
jgi:hypothetical protein